ncbi:MAG: hypothetical protein HYZ53_02280 [Planctomycetes bacterium]|nr:hypothetical protein [Planctomycetota bacterium]
MLSHKCDRCRNEEYIPTHQFVKFDERVQFVCKRCWDGFKKWFFYGVKPAGGYVDNAA